MQSNFVRLYLFAAMIVILPLILSKSCMATELAGEPASLEQVRALHQALINQPLISVGVRLGKPTTVPGQYTLVMGTKDEIVGSITGRMAGSRLLLAGLQLLPAASVEKQWSKVEDLTSLIKAFYNPEKAVWSEGHTTVSYDRADTWVYCSTEAGTEMTIQVSFGYRKAYAEPGTSEEQRKPSTYQLLDISIRAWPKPPTLQAPAGQEDKTA